MSPGASSIATISPYLAELYSDSAIAKIWGIALRGLSLPCPPTKYPEYTQPGGEDYVYSNDDFWTSGFFPGCLALIRQRQTIWPASTPVLIPHPLKLKHGFEWWTENLHHQANRTDTHDLGFMIKPWAQLGWELDRDVRCRDSLVTAAYALASRFDERVGVIRSWDTCKTMRYAFEDPKDDFLVIIDNLMSKRDRHFNAARPTTDVPDLDLLFYVSVLTRDTRLAQIASRHALTTMRSHIRPDNSTYHVVNFDAETKTIKQRLTNQGYSDQSCWARGQAWGIAGFAQVYGWTKDTQFLETSQALARYFIENLPEDSVPYWDFNAPKPGPRDTSAALIAAYGMLLLHEHVKTDNDEYLHHALRIIGGVLQMSLAPRAGIDIDDKGNETVNFGGPETILLNATINNYEYAPRRWADHGLIYADYYFLLIGNTLLDMGILS
ncbi:hypothetical protein MBLNU459_g4836t1 [Dothideomycetes sp. NU459]